MISCSHWGLYPIELPHRSARHPHIPIVWLYDGVRLDIKEV